MLEIRLKDTMKLTFWNMNWLMMMWMESAAYCVAGPSISFFVLLCLRNYSIKELTTNMVCFIYPSVALLETGLTVAYAGSGPILDATEDPVWVPLK